MCVLKKEYDKQSLLDILWQNCAENCQKITVPLTEEYAKLEECLFPLSEKDRDQAIFTVCCISAEKERLAFQEGIRAGVRLVAELADR